MGPAEGFYPLKAGVSLNDARQKALENAKLEFLKIAKKTIRSRLHVRGKPPVYDIARMGVEDITILHQKDVGVVNPGGKYHVEIEAKVVYVLKQKPGAQPPAASARESGRR